MDNLESLWESVAWIFPKQPTITQPDKSFPLAPSFLTIDAISDDVIARLTEKDRAKIIDMPSEGLSGIHFSLGMWIRNHYGLWDKRHPLTREWIEFPDKHDIRDGVDYSENHPDQISTRVMEMVWTKLQGPPIL